ncbi:Kin, partial [Symbiodinium sp. KB8]
MPKATSGPKAIANAWKAKGLQKLRFYCQLCQKQCRDANGFKCHVASESHRRQASLFASNPSSFMDDWSKEFEAGFTKLLSRRFGTREVRANGVYNEYIQDRHHVHMNATMWESLTAFVKYLGRTGKCRVREDERGWWLAWVDHSDDAKRREEAKAKALARER